MKIVLDTNVLVSALLNPEGAPSKVLSLIGNGRVQLVGSPFIFSEYREVLARPRFGFDPQKTAQILDFLVLVGLEVQGIDSGRKLPDPKDLPFLDAALEAEAEFLVTGNSRDFPAALCKPVKPSAPSAFLVAWRGV